ncbi:uncharacterized protein L969DRAFT_55357 [Mixia osmundae IAM 14324]|uniref:Uncharacterized protein n=1 Tax=Mixia osmundae (strain CBS 9802 / IAM 14324 / JCM 22182 / KY 12970) TaxID=764103 RepID=G7E4C0_MIXOS|nr:uncharacterized protein L969DRAFT_55728 [Mixia osmundae IAM 14324]XP_014564859.1 uncharacterized protein L969DRAFT_55357 [Mixia osmundae IAM 14324]KEI36127.1 hypothetical protein L969DRAFT_55728 [Mixia osmundae IAM 14324]KEI36303.1 hypothetical protein L969DRAFT_55357 [Mixia osmundae IAM 14324]GAA97680.1 hypothetical protein E5Q_04358 [Mixia osmundae IAM 14324]
MPDRCAILDDLLNHCYQSATFRVISRVRKRMRPSSGSNPLIQRDCRVASSLNGDLHYAVPTESGQAVYAS